jgi:hypothetical protein
VSRDWMVKGSKEAQKLPLTFSSKCIKKKCEIGFLRVLVIVKVEV